MTNFRNILAALALASFGVTNATNIPADIQQANIFHAFNWNFPQIIAELPNIAEAGYGAIQVSPVQGNCAAGAEWYYAYLPYDFIYKNNGNGNRNTLKKLCDAAEEYGIKIIVDVVTNHVNPREGYYDAWWKEGNRLRDYGSINYNNRMSIIHNNLGNYKDVNSELPEVQERAKAFIEDLKSLGVKGIRWDAAKHIGLPSEHCDFWAKMAEVEGLWHYGEILDNPGGNSDNKWKVMNEYVDYMSVTDNGYAATLRSQFKAGRMALQTNNLTSSSKAGIPADRVVYWNESHDEFANENGATKFMSQDVLDRTYLFLACREKETALYFSRPSKTGYSEIKMGQKGSTNGIENPAIKAVNHYRLNTIGVPEAMATVYGDNGYFVNARKNRAAFILLPKAAEKDVTVKNPEGYLPAGTYTDNLSGNTFTVTDTEITGHVGELGVAVLYDMSDVNDVFVDNDSDKEVFWYDMTGTRVSEPTKGVYIRVQGSRRDKIIF